MLHRSTLSTTATIASLLMTMSAAQAQSTIAVGQPFPDLALPTLDGEVRSISDYRGTKVVLHVFASW